VLITLAALLALVTEPRLSSSSASSAATSATTTTIVAPPGRPAAIPPVGAPGAATAPTATDDLGGQRSRDDRLDGRGTDEGAVPHGTTVFDDLPAVARLDPALLAAVRRAARDAASDGIHLVVNSGWRSPKYQQRLLDEAVIEYGSRGEAERWVSTPETSAHVAGRAIDLGPTKAATWLAHNGTRYGLCRIYGNEPWHFELRPGAAATGCPAQYADPTQDPRMHATTR
jgi:hypothetical protein